MGFRSGAMTFKRFAMQGGLLDQADESFLEKLAARAISADPDKTTDRTQFGWITGEHILDTRFEWSKNVIADGLHFAMRIDTNKPPADIVRGYQRMAEQDMLEAGGRAFLSKSERREAREQAMARADTEAQAGAFRRMKQVPVFWDFKRGEVYLGSGSVAVMDAFMLLFRRTFDRGLVPLSSGELAGRWALQAGETSAFDQSRPMHFVNPPEGMESQDDLVNPADGRSRDFLGTEWLTWLWYVCEVESAEVNIPAGHAVTVLFEKSLNLQCAFNISGTLSISADGPTRLPETPVALAGGKRPVRAGLQVSVRGDVFSFAVRGDAMNISGVQVPQPGNDVTDGRAIFEERIEHLRHLLEAIDGLYAAFLKRRLSGKWSQTLNAIRHWITNGHQRSVAERAAS